MRDRANPQQRPVPIGLFAIAAVGAVAALHFASWIAAYPFFPTRLVPFGLLLNSAAFETASWLIVGVAGVAVGWRLPMNPRRPRFVLHFCALFAGGLVFVLLRAVMLQAFAVYGGIERSALLHAPTVPPGQTPSLLALLVRNFPFHLMLATSYLVLGSGLRSIRGYYKAERDLARLHAELEDVRLSVLRNQLHPRVLAAMESIAAQIRVDAAGADQRLVALSDFMRHQLKRGSSQQVPLRDEVAFAGHYLEFERTCCRTTPSVEFDVPAQLLDVMVPSGSLVVVLESLLALHAGAENSIRLCVSRREATPGPADPGAGAAHCDADADLLLVACADHDPVPDGRAAGGVGHTSNRSIQLPIGGAGGRPRALPPGPVAGAGTTLDLPALDEKVLARTSPDPDPHLQTAFRTWAIGYLVVLWAVSVLHDFVLGQEFTVANLVWSVLGNGAHVWIWGLAGWVVLWLARLTGPFQPRRLMLFGTAALAVGFLNHMLQSIVLCWVWGICFPYSIPGFPGAVAVTVNWFAAGLLLRAEVFSVVRDRRLSLVRSEMTRSHMLALEQQLRPHFLFNALQSIATLLHRQKDTARSMLLGLRELLQQSLAASGRAEVPLEAELRSVRLYLEIETHRFSDRLYVEFRVDPAALQASVPPFLLQPLAENAVHHAVATRGEGRILITAMIDAKERCLDITVEDDGPGPDVTRHRRSNGIGLSNARARLRNLYGDHSTLDLAVTEQGARVRIRIPFHPWPTGSA